MTMPNFFILGAARCATTSLHYYLEQHPDIAMSATKEPNHFAFDHQSDPPTPLIDPASTILVKSVPDRATYERLFADAGDASAVGEASPLYLYTRETPDQIRHQVPDARLIAVVRDPVDRAYSHWLHIKRDRPEVAVEGFRVACGAEMAAGPHYTPYASGTHVLRMGLYADQLQRYLTSFGRESLLVLRYETVIGDPLGALHQICDHLGVDRHDFDTGVQYNPSGVTKGAVRTAISNAVRAAQPRVKALLPGGVASRLGRLRAAHDRPDAAPTLPADLREELAGWFEPSVARLRDLDLVDVSGWEGFD